MRTPAPFFCVLFALSACARPETTPALSGTAVVSSVMAPMDGDPTSELPQRVADVLTRELKAHGLVAEIATPSSVVAARNTERRLELALEAAPDADLVVLLEAEPVFTTQLAGRYRWQVDVDVTLAHPNGADGARTYQWDIPVFLLYHHQREAEALDEAAPMLQRKLARALDEAVSAETE